jgi:murein DD-endopeptidase MepM/ murein hydrolase activator NlpD
MTFRRSALPAVQRRRSIGRKMRAGLRTALHLRPSGPSGPHRAVAPAALASVTAVVGLVIATGASAEARSLAAARPAAATSATDSAGALVSEADIAKAMAAVDPPRRHARHSEDGARASRSSHRAPLHHWVRPNYGPLSSPFGYRWGRLHAGIDLAGPYGSPIVAATDGCISYAGPEAGYGEVMKLTDWDGTETLYGHMSAFVKTSGCVKAGQVIARVGSAGDATGAHLHFEVHLQPGGAPVNPIPFLAKRGVYI